MPWYSQKNKRCKYDEHILDIKNRQISIQTFFELGRQPAWSSYLLH